MNEIHWIDLDGTLWNTDAKCWIIDKNNPKTYLAKISNYEGHKILNGFYRNDGQKIWYNGFDGWLSNDMITKIKQKKNIELSDIGISFREFNDPSLIGNQSLNLITYIDRFKSLQNQSINILTARANKAAHKPLIDLLQTSLDQYNIKIKDQKFINDPSCVHFIGTTESKKMNCIIESIVGYKLNNDRFSAIINDKADTIHFYDDEDLNIEICKNINFFIKLYLSNTEKWLSDRITKSLSLRDIKLNLYLVNTNTENPFDITTIDIQL